MLHFTSYLSISLSKLIPHSKTIKHAKKLSVFGKNHIRRLSKFLKTHIFWNFDHISRTYKEYKLQEYLLWKGNNNSY